MNLTEIRRLAFEVTLAAFLLSLTCPVRADALDNWTYSQIDTNGFWFWPGGGIYLQSVAHGSGRYVVAGASGDQGVVETSDDGNSWILRTPWGLSGVNKLYDVTYGDGKYGGWLGWIWWA